MHQTLNRFIIRFDFKLRYGNVYGPGRPVVHSGTIAYLDQWCQQLGATKYVTHTEGITANDPEFCVYGCTGYDEDKYTSVSDDPLSNLIVEVIKNDSLRKIERSKRHEGEHCILTAAKLISPVSCLR